MSGLDLDSDKAQVNWIPLRPPCVDHLAIVGAFPVASVLVPPHIFWAENVSVSPINESWAERIVVLKAVAVLAGGSHEADVFPDFKRKRVESEAGAPDAFAELPGFGGGGGGHGAEGKGWE
jgi:hypothetical protein